MLSSKWLFGKKRKTQTDILRQSHCALRPSLHLFDGESGASVAYSCIQLTNCRSQIAALPLHDLWEMGLDRMSWQLRQKKGAKDTDRHIQKGTFGENCISEEKVLSR